MQTSAIAERLTEIGHAASAVLPVALNQIIVDDQRLRDWHLAADGGLDYATCIVAKLNGDGEIVRIRTTGSTYLSPGVLDIRYAMPDIAITWSSNAIVADAFYGSGVDLWVEDNELDAFWLDADGVTIKTAHSSDGGHTWGAQSTVVTLPAQGTAVQPQLCAPMADCVVYSDSTVGEDENNNPLTALYMTLKVSGSWITPVLWDLGGQPLGIEQPVVLPNGEYYPSNLSGLQLADGRLELAYYGRQLRESFEDGVWVQRVGNVDVASTAQHLHWAHPQEIFQTIGVDNLNETTQIFEAFPRLQPIGSEYWVVALESSEFAGHERYYLAYHRSADGKHWSDRYTNQGAASDDFQGAHVYTVNDAYSTEAPFLLTDLIYANLVVTADYTFIVGFDKVFYCPSTTLVGVTNPARQLDLTPYVAQWSVNLPAAPTSASATYQCEPLDSELLTARRGVRILHKAGWWTDYLNSDEFLDIGQFWIDGLKQHTEAGRNEVSIDGIDSTMLLDRWKADVFWEYQGPRQMAFDVFCDLIPFIIVQGSMTTTQGGRLMSGIVNKNDNFRDDIAALNIEEAGDGFVTCALRCDRTWDNNHAGIVMQGKAGDNKNFWAVLYNKVNGCFSLHQAIPRPNVNRTKLYKYRAAVAVSGPVNLDATHTYWFKVGLWHGHLMAWYADNADASNFINVLDYTSPAAPVNSVLPCRIGWWGLVGTQRVEPSGALGQLASDGGMQDLSDGLLHPTIVALRVHLGDDPSIVRRLAVAITQENTADAPMPDASIILASGSDTEPDDLTDEDNVLFASDASALHFSAHDSPNWVGAQSRPNPSRVRLDAFQDVWVCVTFNNDLVSGQSYKYASSTTGGTSMISYDNGQTWSTAPAVLAAALEVEYLNGRVKWINLAYGSGENTNCLEELSHQFASKAGVLDISPDSFVTNSELVLGADDILWQPAAYGVIGDMIMDADVEGGTIYTTSARVLFGSTAVGMGDSDANIVEIDWGNQLISFYTYGNTLVEQISSLQYIPQNFHVQVAVQNGFAYVYINECLAAQRFNANFQEAGYFGVDSLGATWSNLRIPDLHALVDYASIEATESALTALQRIVAKPAPGAPARARFFIRYDGSLRIASFAHGSVVDTYADTLITADKDETAQYVITRIVPQGARYAMRIDPVGLDEHGNWFDQRDYTDAFTDQDAYLDGALELQVAQEKGLEQAIQHRPVYATEREDIHTLTNPEDDTVDAEYIVNDIGWTYTPSNTSQQAVQRIGYRKKIT